MVFAKGTLLNIPVKDDNYRVQSTMGTYIYLSGSFVLLYLPPSLLVLLNTSLMRPQYSLNDCLTPDLTEWNSNLVLILRF